MKEITFLQKNSERWKEFESIINSGEKPDPDNMASLFIQLTDDLSFAQTYFPNSKTTHYLNQLTSTAHQKIYRTKKESKSRILSFWKTEYPLVIQAHKKYILYSFLIFFISILIGIVSTAYDPDFTRLILGDAYVNMTIENIEKGDPMAVYKSMNEADMFLGISLNNIKVSLLAFTLGVFLSVGTGLILFYNGVMLGTFQYFFYKYDLLFDSVRTIWIHGTLEIFAIIVAGAAGLTMGNSILFPDSYSRLKSFQRGARDGLKMVLGLVPVFLIAGFLEGFVTRHTEMPVNTSLAIIGCSLLLIIFYFFYYPYTLKLTKNGL